MPLSISRDRQALEPSATLAMAGKAKELKAAGKTVYDFSVGEPDFTTPEHICQAAVAAMKAGHTHYTAASGIPELRAAVAKQYEERHGLKYVAGQVVVSNGAKHSLHNVFTALCNPGDEVIIPAPYWVSYAELVKLTGARAGDRRRPKRPNDFKLTPAATAQGDHRPHDDPAGLLARRIRPAACTRPRSWGRWPTSCWNANLTVVSDEIYERLIYGNHRFASFATVRPGMQERTVIVNGASKAYAMTGWRIGWTLSPANLATAMADLQSQETSQPVEHQPVRGAGGASRVRRSASTTMLAEFAKRREFVRERIASIQGLSCPDMAGAFYAFVNIKAHLGRSYQGTRVDNSTQWCLALLGAAERGHGDGLGLWGRRLRCASRSPPTWTAAGRLRPHRSVLERRLARRWPTIARQSAFGFALEKLIQTSIHFRW